MKRSPFCITLEQIPVEGLHLTGVCAAEVLDLPFDERMQCLEPTAYDLTVGPVQSQYLVRGVLSVTLRCVCDRCLETYDLAIRTEDVCHLIEETASPVIDLTAEIREDILLAFPQACLCSPECRGLCPRCGASLNDGDCACSPLPSGGDVWSGLADLELPSENRTE